MAENELQLMFLATHGFDDGRAIRGAFLVTDANTVPLEFRCTSAVRPSSLHKILYGDALKEHMLVKLIGLPLAKATKHSPSVLLTREFELLNLRGGLGLPVVTLRRHDVTEIETEDGTESPEGSLLASDSGRSEPLVVAAHPDFPEDRETVRQILRPVFAKRSLTEPFDRIATALELIHKQQKEQP